MREVSTERKLLCHPSQAVVQKGWRGVCRLCKSFCDLDSCLAHFDYDTKYPQAHGHYDPQIGALKVASLQHWLARLELPLEYHSVCEVGFGGGFCLQYLQGAARRAVGIEQIPADLAHAEMMGVRRGNLYTFDGRPDVLPEAVSFWLFQDSFEHILDIRQFLEWMVCNSTTDARLFVVAPDAGSLSRALFGRFWPHRLKEHQFHWSRAGITNFLSAYQFGLVRGIYPSKKISDVMVLNHLEIHKSLRLRRICGRLLPSFTLWFNIGEFGLLFQRRHE